MCEKILSGLKPLNQLSPYEKEFLIEHYRRCEAFWRHWTPTLWSLPSVAAAINIGAYSLIFGKEIESFIKVIALGILVVLNCALTVGVWKNRYLQKEFGKRLVALENYASLPTIEFSSLQKSISASLLYGVVMLVIFIVSLVLFIVRL